MRFYLLLLLLSGATVLWSGVPPGIYAAPPIQITGTINGIDGEPLVGATVQEKGTTSGTVTDFDGTFSLNVIGENPVLVISYTGYRTQELPVGSQTTFEIVLEEDAATLNEVVVVGYGIQRKRDVTASISSLESEQITEIAVSSGVAAMQGQVAGVDITTAGNRPGSSPNIRIRGRRSLTASNVPLYVIDGIPQVLGTGALQDINPQDIESMEILKDAAGTAVYGSRGANGVVLVTTKRGTNGPTLVSYDGYYGVTSALRTLDMMDGAQFTGLKRESRRIGYDGAIPADEEVFLDPTELESIAQGRSTNFQDLILQNGNRMNHQLSVRGGSEGTQFALSLGYFDEEGIVPGMDYSRYSARINLDQKIGSIFQTGISFVASQSLQNFGSDAALFQALQQNPLGVPYNEDGSVRFLPTNDGLATNPLAELVPGAYLDERRVTRIFAPLYLKAQLAPGLNFTSNFGPDIRYYRGGNFRGSLTNANRQGPASAGIDNNVDFGYTWENLLNYNKDFGADHRLGITGLQSIQGYRLETHHSDVTNLPYEEQLFYNLRTAEVKGDIRSYLSEWQLASFMGRVNYSFKDKYLFQASLRADGSSRLAEDNSWYYFPGVSVGWRIGAEPFLAGAPWINDLKLRASYGEVGNTAIDPYSTQGGLDRTPYAFGNTPAFGFALGAIPNPELGWEVSKTTNIGLDFDLLNGRFNGSIEYFRTNTENLLLDRNLPPTSGYNSVLQNVGSTRTTGAELSVGAALLDNRDGLTWAVSFNVSTYDEEIISLALRDEAGNPIDDVGNGWFIGEAISSFYDYRKIGIYQMDEVELARTAENKVPGEIKLEDIDGDGLITDADRVIVGSDVPDYFGGITNRFGYKGFDLTVFFLYRQGYTIFSDYNVGFNTLFGRYNNLDVDYWTVNNPTNESPRPNENQERPRNASTMGYADGSFLKLRNVQLGYNLPERLTSRFGLSQLRVYASGQNLWFASKFDTYDPETQDIVPASKIFLAGLKVTL